MTIARLLRLPLFTLALGGLLAPLATRAQDLPSYAHSDVVSTDETIHGRIASVDGTFRIALDDDRGFVDTIALHQGTIINPTGLTLAPGMSVTIEGYGGGSVFNANEIDTPYNYSGVLPTPVYYGPGYWAPGFGYGYGPSFSIAFIFGGGYGRFERHGFYGRPWDGHRYFGGYVGRRDSDGGDRGFEGRVGVAAGTARAFSGAEVRADGGHVPAAFNRRSFAGRPDAGAQAPAGYAERYVQGGGRSSVFAQRGYGQRTPVGGAARPAAAAPLNASGRFAGGNARSIESSRGSTGRGGMRR